MVLTSPTGLLALRQFFTSVITTPEGWLELGTRNGSWQQHWYEYPAKLDDAIEHALEAGTKGDVYTTAHLFSERKSIKANVLPSRTTQADLDNADVSKLAIAPTILVQTSPGRHQGYWVVAQDFDSLESQELTSKRLTYSIPLCDRSGWSLGHKMRVPLTGNYKYKKGPYPVIIVRHTTRVYNIDELELLPAEVGNTSEASNPELDKAFIVHPLDTSEASAGLARVGAYQIIESIKDHLSAKVYAEYLQDGPSDDRSTSLFALETQAFRAGLSREDVYWVAYNSPNNKFRADLRYNAERELAKDVLRAEQAVLSTQVDLRAIINEIRKKTKVLINERKRMIYELVLAALQKEGDFVHLTDDRRFYVPRDTGRPIEVEMNSEALHSLLDVKYALNRTEQEHSYTVSSLVGYAGTLPETSSAAVLSHYDMASKHVLIHSGRRDVYVVGPQVSPPAIVPNGTYGTLFPWDRVIEPFTPAPNPDIDWGATLFDIPNVVNMSPLEARCVLKVWTLFLLLREQATSRPILAFFGQPGSGKTSTARKLYAFFYGRHMDVSGATSPVNYDMATANLPFYVLDNLDTWEKWIPDRLAQSAGKSDVIVRKLYTNNQIVRIKRQAMVAVTAHDPKFGRADVTDRMLILNLQRFSNVGIPFEDEGAILNSVIGSRNRLWGAVFQDLAKVLSTPLPPYTDLQLRIQDFARLGEWIAIALGEQDLFRGAVGALQAAQRSFNLDEDHVLVAGLLRWIAKTGGVGGIRDQDTLYSEVMYLCPSEDLRTFQLLYKNSSAFTKRISNLQDTLNSTMFKIEISVNPAGQRMWSIQPKEVT